MPYAIAGSCMACGDCRNVCPEDSAIIVGEVFAIDAELCLDCGVCVDACPSCSIYSTQRMRLEDPLADDEDIYLPPIGDQSPELVGA